MAMNAYTTKTFKSGNSEAVRLPKDLGFGPGVEVEVQREGDVVTIRRKRMSNRDLVKRLREIGPPPDGVQEREPVEWPERPGL
jgi:antitoxin VapB